MKNYTATENRITELEEEIVSLKAQILRDKIDVFLEEQAEQFWEPEGGGRFVDSSGKVRTEYSTDSCRSFGVERPTRQLAEKARDVMRIHNRALAYVHEHAPDWDASEEQAYIVYLSISGEYRAIADAQFPIGTVVGPEHVMKQLAADLNSGRVKL